MDYLSSMYIDNELDLDEKVVFVDKVHSDPPFYRDTRALLLQEKLLRMPPDTSMLPVRPPAAGREASRCPAASAAAFPEAQAHAYPDKTAGPNEPCPRT